MSESFTPREFIDKINSDNYGPAFDPYEVDGLIRKQQKEDAGADLLAQAKAEVAKEKASITPEAKIAHVEAQIDAMKEWVEQQQLLGKYASLEFRGDVEINYDEFQQEAVVETEEIALWLEEGKGLVLPNHVDGSVRIQGLVTEEGAEGLKLPQSITGSLSLENIQTTKGLELPKTIGGTLTLHSLTSAKGLEFPDSIGQTLDLRGLTDIEGLKLPKEIGRSLYLNSIEKAEDLEFPERIPWNLGLDSLIFITGLELPKSVGNDLNLNSLTSASGLRFPDNIGGTLKLDGLKSADGLELPASIGSYVYLNGLSFTERELLRAQRPDLANKILPLDIM